MATHSSILAWRGPWGRRVGHDRATFVFIHNYEPYKETARPPASSQRGSLSACLCPAVPSPLLSPYFCSASSTFSPLVFLSLLSENSRKCQSEGRKGLDA